MPMLLQIEIDELLKFHPVLFSNFLIGAGVISLIAYFS